MDTLMKLTVTNVPKSDLFPKVNLDSIYFESYSQARRYFSTAIRKVKKVSDECVIGLISFLE